MKRWEFKVGCTLLGWCPVEAAMELDTSPGTILKHLEGELDAELQGKVIENATKVFQRKRLSIESRI
ncbi:hypothetical protein [Aliiruegeria lutimaris]|uniref:Uncharacterized protein n=1 Tax=Aliiruegeria lutimaris TaxID=571298 RepID=A0A1G9DWC8_9RHOB|nr:hypothetical protein [Aliiruegeria lutimaris]SDK68157.1 hypothetical protein SAMN04488026_104934 [Aliiruegeria lutimaris]